MDKRKRLFLQLAPSETAVFRAAADIFAGYIAAGLINPQNETDMMRKSVSHALLLAEFVEEVVISDDEIDPDEKS